MKPSFASRCTASSLAAAGIKVAAATALLLLIHRLISSFGGSTEVTSHLFLVIVLLASLLWGTTVGMGVALAAALIFVPRNLPAIPETGGILLALHPVILYPLAWGALALLFGEISRRRLRAIRELSQEATASTEHATLLASRYLTLEEGARTSEARFLSNGCSVATLLGAIARIDTADPRAIITGIGPLVSTVWAPAKCSVYLVRNEGLVVEETYGWAPTDQFDGTFPPTSLLFHSIVFRAAPLSASSREDERILGNHGMLAVPILCGTGPESVLGMIKIEEIDLANFTRGAELGIVALGVWAGHALRRPLERTIRVRGLTSIGHAA